MLNVFPMKTTHIQNLTLNKIVIRIEFFTHGGESCLVVVGERHADFLRLGLTRLLHALLPLGLDERVPATPHLLGQDTLVVALSKVRSKRLK